MKCVIFCGGKGTRLYNETEFKPKCLVEIGGKPILWHILKIYSHFDIKDFILTLGYKGTMVKRYFMEYKWRNSDFTIKLDSDELTTSNNSNLIDDWNVTCCDTGLESRTGLRLFKIKEYLKDEEDFCLTYGDGVGNVNIKELIKYHKEKGKIVTITGLHPRSKFGLLITNKENIVTNFDEKPILPDTINAGFMVVNKRIFDYLTDENEMLVYSILPKLAKMGEVSMYRFNGFWHCMDTQKDFDNLNLLWENESPWKIWK